MGISTNKVGKPVRAQSEEVTAESIPPLTPTTHPAVPALAW
jgi:hypothetical protein